jgi:hypothetical protein
MPHPIDPHVQRYNALIDDLGNVERNLKQLAPLQEKKAQIETEMAELRAKMAEPDAAESAKS